MVYLGPLNETRFDELQEMMSASRKEIVRKFDKTDGLISVVLFDPETKKRLLTYDGLNVFSALTEIAARTTKGRIIKVYFNLPAGGGKEEDLGTFTVKYKEFEMGQGMGRTRMRASGMSASFVISGEERNTKVVKDAFGKTSFPPISFTHSFADFKDCSPPPTWWAEFKTYLGVLWEMLLDLIPKGLTNGRT